MAPRADALREEGWEVDEFLADAERFIAALEGRGEEEFDVPGFLARLTDFVEEVKQVDHLQKQAEAVATVAAIPGMIDDMEKAAAHFREHGGAMEAQTARDLDAAVTAARERMALGELPAEELGDITLTLSSQMAELERRILFRSIILALYWEKQTPEWWAQLPEKARVDLGKVVARWQEEREELLGKLPIEDRRRLEAMKLEDFDKPPGPI